MSSLPSASLSPQGQPVSVQIVYAHTAQHIWVRQLSLSAGSTASDALQASHFFREFPNYAADCVRVGVFGRECALGQILNDGDRLEIYRPLVFDPMESRRRRAVHRKSVMNRPVARRRKKREPEAMG